MRRRGLWIGAGMLALALGWLAGEAQALITALTPMKEVLSANEFILIARVEKFDPEKLTAILVVQEDLKGKLPPRRLPLNLMTGDKDAKKLKHIPQIVKRLAVDLPIVLFVSEKDERYIGFAYTNGTWFQMVAQVKEGDPKVVWAFTHGEPYLRRTFKGTTAEMKKVILEGLKDLKKLPAANEKEPPGFGPEVAPKTGQRQEEGGPLFAVIPTLGIGGPLAILALLFPSLFGGVLVLFRRWLAFFTVISMVTTLYLLHAWLRGYYWGDWWTTPLALWTTLLALTALGALWSWQRHLTAMATEPDAIEPPRRTELIVLTVLTVSCLALMVYYLLIDPPSLFGSWWDLLLAFSIAIWAGTLYKIVWVLWHPQTAAAPVTDPLAVVAPALSLQPAGGPKLPSENFLLLERPASGVSTNGHAFGDDLPLAAPPLSRLRCYPLPTEGVMLWVALLACVGLTALRPGVNQTAADQDAAGKDRQAAVLQEDAIRHIKLNFKDRPGTVFSSPLIVGDRVYVAANVGAGAFAEGVLCCFDLNTREKVWDTIKDGKSKNGKIAMKQIFSTPFYADGCLYIGEGFHQDTGCRLFCIDAATGRLKWRSEPSESHIESSPVVVGGKVFVGAGDDGVYCWDAKTDGKRLWQFPGAGDKKELHLHVDAKLAVVDGKVYGGSGIDEEEAKKGEAAGDPAIFCLDAATGRKIWLHRTPQLMTLQGDKSGKKLHLPCWGGPVVDNGQVFFGLGTGRMTVGSAVFEPMGALLAVDAATGKPLWKPFQVGDGVLNRVALDRHRVYFGSRDGYFYCVGRYDGELRWKKNLGSPVVATPALDVTSPADRANTVFALSANGRVSCVDAHTGKVHWNYTKLEQQGTLLGSSPTVTITPTARGERRRICFGTAENGSDGVYEIANLYFIEDLLPDR